jgi:uncharacterized membrane protein YheB (UPF0754 family)
MNQLFFWLIPPIVGAIIGYVTNAVAIKMLFRPLKAYYIGALRVPFTPGILPRQRHKLADSIGSMVERELLTPEILRERISREDVKAGITASIAAYTAMLLNKPLSTVKTIQADNPFSRLFREFFSSSAFDSFVDSLIDSILSYIDTNSDLQNKSIKDILGSEHVNNLQAQLEKLLETQMQARAKSITAVVITVVSKEIPRFTEALMQLLNKKEIRSELEVQGQVFLSRVLLKLGTFQRFFLSMGHYDETLQERMPEIITDLIGQIQGVLEDEKMRQRFLDILSSLVEQFLLNAESVKSISETLTDLLVRYTDLPLKELFGAMPSFKVKDLIERLLRTVKTNVPSSLWAHLFETYRSLTLAEFFSIDSEKKGEIDRFLADKIVALAKDEITGILSSINVKTLVSDRINSLDMISVERIVLDVMANQFKWINVFGAILGALIGLSQVFLNGIRP